MIKPVLPEPGTRVTIFGVDAVVIGVEPADDWNWSIDLSSVSTLGNAERWSIELPSDFHTITGRPVN